VNIEQKLHERWAAVDTLNSLLAASRVFTGRIPADTTLPCARLYVSGSLITKMGNKSIERTVQIRFQHWAAEESYGEGRAIQTAIEETFANHAEDLDDSRLVNLKHELSSCVQGSDDPNDKLWHFVTQFQATVQKDRTL